MSRPYRTPSLLEQFGLRPDPNKLEHVVSSNGGGGNLRLTKVLTQGGHPYESEQKGLPVYHRRLGNPLPLVFFGIGGTLAIIAPILVGARDLTQLNIFIAIGLPLGTVGNLTAAMFGFAQGNTFAATLGSVFGGLIGSLCMAFVPLVGIQAAFLSSAPSLQLGALALYKALSLVFFVAFCPVFFVYIAALKTAMPIAGGAMLICIAVILQGVHYLHYPKPVLQTTCGALFMIVAIILCYLAMAVMNQEEGINVPVFPLPHSEDHEEE